MLERASGPFRRTEIEGRQYEIEGWEVFESDGAGPHMYRS